MNKNVVLDNNQTFWLAFGKIISLLATLAIPLFLTRFLDKDEYGFYNQFNTVIFFLSTFFSFGMYSNIYYYYPSISKERLRSLIVHTLIFLSLFGFLSGVLIFIPCISDFFLGSGDLQQYKIIIYLLTILLTIISIVHPLYIVRKDIVFSAWFPMFQVAIKLIIIIGFFIYIPSIDSIINAIVFSTLIVLIIIGFYIYKILNEWPGTAFINKLQLEEQFKYNMPIGLSIALKTFSERFDKLIGITYLSTASYASYSVAFFGIPGIQQIYDSISQVTIVNMVKCFVNADIKTAHELYKTMVIKTLSFSLPLILIVSVYAKEIISFLFTDKYSDATPLFQMYLISFVFVTLGAGLILRASGQTKHIIRAFFLASFFTIPSTYFLIKYYGSLGAMIGALISIILPKIYQIWKEIEITNSTFRSFLPWKEIGLIFLVNLVCVTPLFLLHLFCQYSGVVYLLLTSILYLSIVFLLEIKLRVFIVDKTNISNFIKRYKF